MIAARRVSIRSGTSLAWVVPAAVACALVAGFVLQDLPGITGDTIALVHGARTVAYCLSHGITEHCDRLPQFVPGSAAVIHAHGIVEGAVGPEALYQYLEALLFTQLLGMGNATVYQAFSVVSLLSFVAVVAICAWAASRTSRPWAPALIVLILVTSPLIYYAWLTFGESLAALLLVLIAVAALRRWPPISLALCAALATITKETVFPVVAILGAVSLWATPIGARPLGRRHWIGLASGIVFGVGLSAAFNWFRYGQLTNYTYLHSYEQVPGLGRRLNLAASLWLSPNGGVAVFWTLAAVIALVLLVIAFRTFTMGGDLRRIVPAAGLLACLVLLTGTLASWFAPFGWVAWGPRLILPSIPAICLIAVVVYAEELERALRRLFSSVIGAAVVALAVVAVGLPQVNVLHASAIVGNLFLPDRSCPVVGSLQLNPGYYYHCLDHWAWGRHWILLDSFKALDRPAGVIFAAAFTGIWICLIAYIRACASPRRDYARGQTVNVAAST